jgi:hypothetical protein
LTKKRVSGTLLLDLEKSRSVPMVLRRSLLSPAGLRVPAYGHSVGLPLRPSGARSSASPKPTNPLRLKLFVSVGYTRIDPLQTHCHYLAYFQELIVRKWPFFRKSAMVHVSCRVQPRQQRRRRPSRSASATGIEAKHVPERSWKVAWNQGFPELKSEERIGYMLHVIRCNLLPVRGSEALGLLPITCHCGGRGNGG